MSDAAIGGVSDAQPGARVKATGNESLRRGFEILRAVADHGEAGVKAAVIGQQTGLPRTTTVRLLATLVQLGAVDQEDNGTYRLGPEMLRLNAAFGQPKGMTPFEVAASELAARTGETVMVGVPSGPLSVRVVAQISGTYIVSARLDWEGSVLRSLDSGFVQLLLGQYSDQEITEVLGAARTLSQGAKRTVLRAVNAAREVGYVIVDDATEEGLTGIGAAFYREGSVQAMVAVYMPTFRVDDDLITEAVETFRETASSTGTVLIPSGQT